MYCLKHFAKNITVQKFLIYSNVVPLLIHGGIMNKVLALIATGFATVAFAQAPAPKAEPKKDEKKVEVKKEEPKKAPEVKKDEKKDPAKK